MWFLLSKFTTCILYDFQGVNVSDVKERVVETGI